MTPGELIVKMSHEPVYLKNDQENMVLRSEPGGKTFGRFSGKKEYLFGTRSKIIIDSILMNQEITRKEYYNF